VLLKIYKESLLQSKVLVEFACKQLFLMMHAKVFIEFPCTPGLNFHTSNILVGDCFKTTYDFAFVTLL
jgi:hypothetical protein